jgi:hypothetical protein
VRQSVRPITIISGGQTGADRAALDFAIETALPHSGWCPKGRRAEDSPIPPHYDVRETPSRRYSQRTEWNVRDSDATVVFTIGVQVSGGTALTLQCAERLGKPSLHLSRDALLTTDAAPEKSAADTLIQFLEVHKVHVLNVAGPRASQEPAIAEFVRDVFMLALSD